MSKAKVHRIVYRVFYEHGPGEWSISVFGGPQLRSRSRTSSKIEAVRLAREAARETWLRDKQLSQLVVHSKNGVIQYENTYGKDPKRSKG